jgi:regulator of nonsense transcripts 3
MAPPTGVNGVLPVTVLQKSSPPSAPRGPKASQPRLKLLLRRLPPGLTKPEFETMLGDEWKVGAGKIDWLEYKKGKVSKEYVLYPSCASARLTRC